MTVMTTNRLRPEIGEIKTIDGVEMIFEACGRCGGTGSYGPMCVDSGICFDCRVYSRQHGHYGYGGKWVVKADYDRRARNRELAAARRERKAAEFAAGEAARYEALVAAHPLLAELTYLGNVATADGRYGLNYDGILGSMRGQFERKGSLTDRQIAAAEKMIREDYQRQAAKDERDAKYAAERAARPNAAIGEVGERRDFTGTVRFTKEFENSFNGHIRLSTLIILDTPEGAVKWFASGAFDLNRGETITLKATVKEHELYTPEGGSEDDAQITTVVTRGKILN